MVGVGGGRGEDEEDNLWRPYGVIFPVRSLRIIQQKGGGVKNAKARGHWSAGAESGWVPLGGKMALSFPVETK